MAEETPTQTTNEQMSQDSLANLVELLASPRRRQRQEASHIIAEIAEKSPDQVVAYADDLIDALMRPEAQTRWECFDALSSIARTNPGAAAGGLDAAEDSLFDEASAPVRLSAFKFLARLGATSPEHSEQVWPLLDEAVQCYHGDPEYRDMLKALVEFAKGSISDRTRQMMADRFAFDAESGRGYVKSLSVEITQAVSGKE